MNGLTQSTTAKILALKKITELDLLKIIDAALVEHEQPHKEESDRCKQLVNDTQEDAREKIKAAQDERAAKQNEVIQLRSERDDALGKVIAAASEIGKLQDELEIVKGQLSQTAQEAATMRARLRVFPLLPTATDAVPVAQ